VARDLKVNCLLDLLTKHHTLGELIGYMWSIEFQKRGLPHIHFLGIPKHPFITAAQIDAYIRAELPPISDADLQREAEDYTASLIRRNVTCLSMLMKLKDQRDVMEGDEVLAHKSMRCCCSCLTRVWIHPIRATSVRIL
jgi:hypothetical protein